MLYLNHQIIISRFFLFLIEVDVFEIEFQPSFWMKYLFAGLESPLHMSGVSSAFTSLGHSKSSSQRRRKRAGRHTVERQTSIENYGEISPIISGNI